LQPLAPLVEALALVGTRQAFPFSIRSHFKSTHLGAGRVLSHLQYPAGSGASHAALLRKVEHEGVKSNSIQASPAGFSLQPLRNLPIDLALVPVQATKFAISAQALLKQN
jgi:hypothetical protein